MGCPSKRLRIEYDSHNVNTYCMLQHGTWADTSFAKQHLCKACQAGAGGSHREISPVALLQRHFRTTLGVVLGSC